MRGRVGAAVLAAVLASCKGAPVVEVEVPAEGAWVAVLGVDAQGGLRGASAMARWRSGEGVPVFTEGRTLVAVYGDAQLAPFASFDPAAGERLQAAGPCAQRLPAPLWLGEWNGEGLDARPPGEAPPLTSDGIAASCPAREIAAVVADVRCAERRCVPAVTITGPCTFDLDLTGCGLGAARGVRDRDGALCVTTEECAPAEDRGADASLDCGACEVDLRLAPDATPPPLEVARVPLLDVAPYVPLEDLSRRRTLTPLLLLRGWARDLAVVGDRVLVATSPDTPLDCAELGTWRGVLQVRRADTLALVATATAPPCLARLAAAPPGDEALAVSAEGGVWSVHRVDAAGRVLASRVLDLSPATHHAAEIVAVSTSSAAVVLAPAGVRTTDADVVYLVGWRSLAARKIELGPGRRGFAAALSSPGALAIAAELDRNIARVDLATGRPLRSLEVPIEVETGVLALGVHPAFDGLLAGGIATLFLVPASGAGVTTRPTPASELTIEAFARWPASADVVLVAGSVVRGTEVRAAAALFDVRRQRFTRTEVALGEGTVTRVVPAPGGGLLALLPWAPALVKLTPR